MNSFLYRVAEKYYFENKYEISNFTFVFPNRRASLFFQKYLSEICTSALFSPELITINDCFARGSNLLPSDRLSNLFRIYKIYQRISGTQETFDSFVFWGEMLLNDFDEVDKYLVDAAQLFRNVTELNEIEQLFEILSDRQIAAIRQFWTNFIPVSDETTKEQFLSTWKVLNLVYDTFTSELQKEQMGTEGMICKSVIERLTSKGIFEQWQGKQFVFVGFNALNPCEKALMHALQKHGMADFYWDYEADFLKDPENPASLFYAENTSMFPSKYALRQVPSDLHDKEFKLVGIPSAVGITKYVYSELESYNSPLVTADKWLRTAVVMADENLLLPMLYAFPANVDKINITMGYPLSSTPVAGLVALFQDLNLRKRVSNGRVYFYHKNISDILNHQYISQLFKKDAEFILTEINRYNKIYVDAAELHLNPFFSFVFSEISSADQFLLYLIEILSTLEKAWHSASTSENKYLLERDFLLQYQMTLTRVSTILHANKDVADISVETLGKIIKQLIAGVSIPFVGEPLDGLQVMGMLESRGLDFEHLIITNFNEGVFPKKSNQNSFIPYNLRRGFGLPTYEMHDAISSYNFYRLIHRAQKVSFVFDARSDGSQSAEVSRYINQLNYLYGLTIKPQAINYDISFAQALPITVSKSPEVMLKLQAFLDTGEQARFLSASSIKSYIDCPLQFYFNKVEKVNELDEVVETIEDSMFGTLFHAVMEYIYTAFKGQVVTAELIDNVMKNSVLVDNYIRKAFAEVFFMKKNGELPVLEGNQLLIANVIRKYVLKLLQFDKLYAPFTLLESERCCSLVLPTKYGGLNITGVIDRIDEKNGRLRVLDYKTGGGSLDFAGWQEVFEHNNDKRPKYVLQTFLYGLLYKEEAKGRKVEPGIIYLREIFKDNFRTEINDKLQKSYVDDFALYEDEFVQNLTVCVEEIFDETVPFTQSISIKPCEYCSYKMICKR